MPSTYELIKGETIASAAASYTFTAIPSTFTDLVVRCSYRGTVAGLNGLQARVTFNSVTSGYSFTEIYGTGAAAASNRGSSLANIELDQAADSAGNTASTFTSSELYVPNYTVAANKPMSSISAPEQNSTTAYLSARAGLWSNTAAITSITLTANVSNFDVGSSFYLYGIKNS